MLTPNVTITFIFMLIQDTPFFGTRAPSRLEPKADFNMATAPTAGDETLTPDDAVKVLEELLPAQNQSYVLGLKLGLPLHDVEGIHYHYYNPRDRLLKVIMEFLKQEQTGPTWRVIVDALRSPAVNLPRLAKRVEAAHFPDPTSTRDVVPETTTAAESVASTTTDTSGDVIKPKTPSQLTPTGDETLTPNDAVNVLEELLPAQNQSYTLSLKLGLPLAIVEEIYMAHMDPRDRLLHIIITFLKGVKPRPTWRVIVNALRSPAVNLPALAKRVEAAHFPDPASTRDVVPETTTAAESVASTTTDTSGEVVKSKTPSQLTPTGDKTLTPNDVANVLEELLLAQNQSYTLSLKLGLPLAIVEDIYMAHMNPRDRLLHIIITFLKGVKPRPTWRVIVNALRSPAVNLPALAKRVEAAHFPYPTSTRDVVPETTTAAESVASTTTDTSGEVVKSKTPSQLSSVVIVQDEIKGFHKRFNSIKVKTIKCLKKWQIAVRTVVSLLTSIFAVTDEHKLFSETHNSLYGCEDHWELFGMLHLYWNYLSYDLLDHVIKELTPLKNEAISKEMAVYKEDLQKFRQHTTLEIFCQAQSKMEADLPPGFRKMVVIHNWPSTATLEDVEKFRQCYSQTYNLQKCAMMLHSVGTGSFAITWFVPVTIIDILRKSRARKVYKEFKVSRLEIYYVETTAVCVYKQAETSLQSGRSDKQAPVEEDYSFVDDPSDEFFCPVTLADLLLQPHLTSCCGNHLSQEVATRIQREGGACPLCRKPGWSTVLNKHFQRQVTELHVFCRHKDEGCGWQGELSDLERHVRSCPMRDTPDLPPLPVEGGKEAEVAMADDEQQHHMQGKREEEAEDDELLQAKEKEVAQAQQLLKDMGIEKDEFVLAKDKELAQAWQQLRQIETEKTVLILTKEKELTLAQKRLNELENELVQAKERELQMPLTEQQLEEKETEKDELVQAMEMQLAQAKQQLRERAIEKDELVLVKDRELAQARQRMRRMEAEKHQLILAKKKELELTHHWMEPEKDDLLLAKDRELTQVRQQVQVIRQQVQAIRQQKDELVQSKDRELAQAQQRLREKEEQLRSSEALVADFQKSLQQKDSELESLRAKKPSHSSYLMKKSTESEVHLRESMCDVIAQRVVQITNDEETILWERYGLRLHIPSNALPDNVSQLQLKIEVSASGNFELREDSILVSAVYSFSHDLGDRNLRRPVTLQIQHCATIAAIGKLNFIRADKTFDASAPCKFHIVEGGVFFNRSDGYGEIKLHRFCSIGIQLWWYRHVVSWFYTLKPCAALYYTNINVGRQIFQFHLYVFPWLNAVKELIADVLEEDAEPGPNSSMPFEFVEGASTIALELPSDRIDGWKMVKLNSLKMNIDDIVNLRYGPSPIRVEVRWDGGTDEGVKPLTYKTKLSGVRGHDLTVTLPNQLSTSLRTRPTSGRSGKLDIDKDLLQAKEILTKLEKSELRGLFQELGLSDSTVENNYAGSATSDYAHNLIRQWIRGDDKVLEKGEPTWENLKKALKKRGHAGIARDI